MAAQTDALQTEVAADLLETERKVQVHGAQKLQNGLLVCAAMVRHPEQKCLKC